MKIQEESDFEGLTSLADKALLRKLKNFHAIQVLQTLPDQVN